MTLIKTFILSHWIDLTTAKFGLYVTPKKAGHAELTLGGVDHTKLHTPMIFAPLPFSGGGWVLPSPGINVNGKTVPVLQTNRQISFDSGTSSLAFSKETTEVRQGFPALSHVVLINSITSRQYTPLSPPISNPTESLELTEFFVTKFLPCQLAWISSSLMNPGSHLTWRFRVASSV